jgi:hypothetical protein
VERSFIEMLDELLTIERTHRLERRVAANLRLSGIPTTERDSTIRRESRHQ